MGAKVSKQIYAESVLPSTQEIPTESSIYRNSISPQSLVTSIHGVETLYQNFQYGLSKAVNRPFVGTRKIFADGSPGEFEWKTYNEIATIIDHLGSGFMELGLEPGACVGIYSPNRSEWLITEQACNAYSFISVPLYDTLGPDAVEYVLNQTQLSVIVCSADKVPELLRNAQNTPSLKFIIEMDHSGSRLVSARDKSVAQQALTNGISSNGTTPSGDHQHANILVAQVVTAEQFEQKQSDALCVTRMTEIQTLGQKHPHPHHPPASTDLATICYTSGTTGAPKGVMLTHGNFCAALAGSTLSGVQLYQSDVHLSYLPLAHVFERIVEVLLIHNGASIGFFRGEVTQILEDIAALRPTLFPSVPRLFNRIYDKVMQGVGASNQIRQFLFRHAMNTKQNTLRKTGSTEHMIWDRLVFSKLRALLGGRVRLMVTGSAPMSEAVKEFLQVAFCAPVIEGYGLTETVGIACVTPPTQRSPGQVGAPVASTELKLVDIPEMQYTHKDSPRPRGEICLRGPNIFVGYYKHPKATEEAIDAEGWFHTGDVGVLNIDGTVSIIDRKKNIFKLAQGEYIAPDKIENVYARAPLIAQAFVYGDSLQSELVAIIVPDPETVEIWAKEHNMKFDLAELCHSSELKTAVFTQMKAEAKEAQLRGFENARAIYLEPESFTVENDLLTPTFKLKRPQLKSRYEYVIERLYDEIHQ